MIAQSSGRGLRRAVRYISAGLAAVCGLACLSLSASAGAQATTRLPGRVAPMVLKSKLIGRVPAQEQVTFAISLPLRNQVQLQQLLKDIYDPKSPQYGQYLTPQQFTDQFGPTQADYDAVTAYATAQGLTIKSTTPNRVLLDVTGSAQTIEAAFSLKLLQYRDPDGRIFRSPDSSPAVPAVIAGKLLGIIGLDNSVLHHAYSHVKRADPLAFLKTTPLVSFLQNFPPPAPNGTGSGPNGDLTPTDIRTAYNLNIPGIDGTGQVLGLYELDGYNPSDIALYEQAYGLPNVPLQNIYVDGYNGTAGFSAGEVVLDIEMMTALAPNITKIVVYEGANDGSSVYIDLYNRIATDNIAKSVSTSWGLAEFYQDPASGVAEDAAFMQMAAQGQSMFAASGDNGAYVDGTNFAIQDPADQPHCTAVGGTKVTTDGPGGPWINETTWHIDQTIPFDGGNDGGSGGGISTIWGIPDYQIPFINAQNGGSTTMRNAPDVALNADYNNEPFSIYLDGSEQGNGGTSAAAPLWAAFTALVNQQRAVMGRSTLGFSNYALYSIAAGPRYNLDFHDIADGSNNLFYTAVTGYDLTTGLGSFNGLNMLNDLAASNFPPPPPPVELLGNRGFENGAKRPQPWVASLSVIDNFNRYPAFSGKWKAWFAGYGSPHTDTLHQTVTIPSNISSARLSYELLVDAQQVLFPVSTLTVQLRDTSGNILQTLDQFTDLDDTYNPLTGRKEYRRHSYSLNVNRYKGKTVQLYVTGVDGNYLPVSFVADLFSLLVQPIAPAVTPPVGPPTLPGIAR